MAKKRHTNKVAQTLQVDDADDLRARALSAAAERVRRPTLVVVVGDDVGRRAAVTASSFVIGRADEADLVLDDPRISSTHCRLEDRGGSWGIIDLSSTNGTQLNGDDIGDTALRSHDKIALGDTVLRFELMDAADEAYDKIVQRMLSVDDLSGLYLRRRFDREVSELVRDAKRRDVPLGMLVMDLDGIKAINDQHGHLMGAYVIGESGRVIGKTIPPGAIASRFGGDEYVVACPGLGVEGTHRIGESIVQAIGSHRFEKDGVRVRPGISVGAAALPEHAEDPNGLFRRADEAMYVAKRNGKNRVSIPESQ